MKRDLAALTERTHDLIVVGAGLPGAWAAWDAALRGLKVALVEAHDLGGAASANSLKVLHGGFRYLQGAQIGRLRASHRETLALLRLAPHLCRPLPCLLPLFGWGKRGPLALGLAAGVFNLLVRDLDAREGGGLPPARLLGREEMEALAPPDLTGGAGRGLLWHDGLLVDAPRLALELAQSAARLGATVANHTEVTALISAGGRVTGVRALDRQRGGELFIAGRAVLAAAGAATAALCGERPPAPALAHAYNLVVERRPPAAAVACASLSGPEQDPVCGGGRFLFMVPWQGKTLLGTSYWPCAEPAASARPRPEHLQALLEEFNLACPGLKLSRREVSFFHWGLLPLARPGQAPAGGGLADKPLLRHHGRDNGPQGLFSLRPVKLTTARADAQAALDLIAPWLGAGERACRTLREPLISGGDRGGDDLGCRVAHAAREEMALGLDDLVLRRMDLGQGGRPPREALEAAGSIMARELGWDAARLARETARVEEVFALLDQWRAMRADHD